MSAESLVTENYIKAIFMLSDHAPSGAAATGDLARRLALTPGSVTAMLRRLNDARLIDYQAHQGARLTPAGRRLALKVIRRHRLLELFLARTLDMTWDEVHDEAEHLEHAASDRLIDRIDRFLGYPQRDPHGDPIPDAHGDFRASDGEPLPSLPPGTPFVLLRVTRDSPDFLRFLADGGLVPGAAATLLDNNQDAGVLTVQAGHHRTSLGHQAADGLLVRRT